MTIRQVVYLVFIVLFALTAPLGCYIVIHQPVCLPLFPGMVLIFRSCLRLYMFPNELFNPYTGFSKNDSAVFKKYNRIVFVSSMIVGCLMIYFMFKLWP